jgi:phosphoribosylglycinamide formyltransferase-1
VPSPLPLLAVFASGRGSNFGALAEAARRGELGGEIRVLLCDQPGAPVLERARRFGIEGLTPSCGRFRTKIEDEGEWIAALRERGVGTILLAGFMRRLHAPLLDAFGNRTLNIHPSLLPAFPGLDAIARAWRAGVRVTGCTVHLVTADLDAGPILAQRAVEVGDEETLESLETRIHAAEHALYPATVRRFLTEPGHVEDGRWAWTAPVGAPRAGGPR